MTRQEGIDHLNKIFGILPISYNGGKKPIFKWIADVLSKESVEHHRVFDGFSGTGVISSLFGMMGKETYSCDFLQTAYCMSVTLAQNDGEIIDEEDLSMLCSHRSVDGVIFEGDDVIEGLDLPAERFRGFLTRNECAWLSMANRKLMRLSPLKQMLGQCAIRAVCCLQPYGTPHGCSTFKHRVKQKDKYGNKCLGHYMNSSYEIEVGVWFKKYCEKFSSAVCKLKDIRISHSTCYRMDTIDALALPWIRDVDLAYFDPPYGRRNRGYLVDYGLTESILGSDEIPFNDFDTVEGHGGNFDKLLEASSSIDKVILSYDDKSWKDIPTMIEGIKKHGRKVRVETCPHIHGKTPNKECKRDVVEHLIIAERN